MKIETIKTVKLTADEGEILTDGTSYGHEFYLEDGRSPDDYHEITVEEYNKKLEQELSVLENGA